LRQVTKTGFRTLVTTLTKRMSEELTQYMTELGMRVRYLHSDIDTLERTQIIADLRRGVFDVLVGINLLREGLDLPEVALVAILDADKEGFLRSETALIQTAGRAARNVESRVLFYADRITGSMQRAIDETSRRRQRQADYNRQHGIEPTSILKDIHNPLVAMGNLDLYAPDIGTALMVAEDQRPLRVQVAELEKKMRLAAKNLEFEEAAMYRDRLKALREIEVLAG